MFTPLTAKLHIPAPRHNGVARPRLLARLAAHPITLISAPAGAGKSTLLTDWAAQTACAVAWVSLDDDDNDPARFWSYLVTALHGVAAHAGQTLLHSLNGGSDAALQPLLIDLLNDLNQADQPGALVLDDYHAILAPDIHDGVRFFLEHLPATLRVVIATRVDPPLPLARWRVRDQLTELRGSDLQFTRDEAASFLARTMGLSLTLEQSQALTDRTEGWIAGLQLAALSLHGAADAPRAIAALTGAHQHVLDYLVEEVLAAQPADVQTFLMQTAILDRFCAPLCDAVLDRADSADVLIKLDKDNLFLVPLDAERQWFRYHRLFAELLRARSFSLHPMVPAQLHAKAAEWFEAAGSPEEAIGHALAAGDVDRAARLIERAWEAPLHAGQIVTVQRWLNALPVAALDARPLLRAVYGWTLVLRGRHAEAEPHALAAEAALAAGPGDARTQTRTQAEIACLRSLIARVRGQAEQAQAFAEQAIALAPPDSALLRGNAYVVLGQVYFDQGQLDRALAAYREALPLTLAGRNFVAVSLTRTYAALALRQLGRLHEAAATCREGLQLAAELGFEHLPAVSVIDVTLATILYEWDELAEAERHAARAYELGRRGGYAEGQRVGGALLAKIRLARGQLAEASELLTELAAAPQSGAAVGIALLVDVQVRQRLALDEMDAALRLAGALAEKVRGAPIMARAGAALILARALLAARLAAEAFATLEECTTTLEAHEHWGALIEALVVRARTLAALDQPDRAQADLRRALTLAASEGYTRVFVDEGEAVRRLLLELKDRLEAQASDGDERLARCAARLLAAFSPAEDFESQLQHSASRTLIEPLTDRELEVLRLMADGLTNSEIAAKLIVAESTVKKHINHLFDKLDTQTRVQAINIARDLELI